MKKILVIGGAGYIGSVTVKKLLDAGHDVLVVDNLSKGKKSNLDRRASFYKLDILDFKKLSDKFKDKKFDAIMHFAALKDAGESMTNLNLYQDNITRIMNLLKIASKCKVEQFIFSSSVKIRARRKGDIAKAIASSKRAKKILSWMPKFNLKDMVESTWRTYAK